MDLDTALSRLGKWGKWQIMFYLIICVTCTFPSAWHVLAIVFLGESPFFYLYLALPGLGSMYLVRTYQVMHEITI